MSSPRAEIGLVGGTGLSRLSGLQDVQSVAVDTPYGPPSAPLQVGTLGGRRVAFLARHGHGHSLLPTEIPWRANVHALKQLGVSKVLATGAVGSLVEHLPPRSLVVPDQLIDRTRHRVDTFFGEGLVARSELGYGEQQKRSDPQCRHERASRGNRHSGEDMRAPTRFRGKGRVSFARARH